MNRLPLSTMARALPLLALLLLPGCGVLILGGAAVGTAAYASGNLEAALEGGFEQAVRATDQAIADNGISELSRDLGPDAAVYVLRSPEDYRVELTLTRATGTLTDIVIRVGTFGDEKVSRHLLHEIGTRLK